MPPDSVRPLTERLVDAICESMRTLDSMPRHNPDHPNWTALDSVIHVHLEMWAHHHGGTS